MKYDFNKIINIKSINDINKFAIDKPIFFNNYLFHYLIIFNKLEELKLTKFPIYEENEEGYNGFLLAAKYKHMDILKYLIKTYPEYIYNKNNENKTFLDFLDINNIIKLFKYKLNWNLLLKHKLNYLFANMTLEQLNKLFKIYTPKNKPLHYLTINDKLTEKQLISLLDKFPDNLNIYNTADQNLIFPVIFKKRLSILKYLIDKNLVLDYYTFYNTYHPLIFSYRNKFMDGYALIWKHIKSNFNYNATNKYLDNIGHVLLFNNNIKLDKTSLDILENLNNEAWLQLNIDKNTPLHLLCYFNFDEFHYLIKNISITKNILEDLEKENKELNNSNFNNWIKFINKLPIIKDPINIEMNNYKYSNYNLFRATFKDMIFYINHYKHKYKNLYIPTINDQLINNIASNEFSIPWPDNLFNNKPIFPWIIIYENKNKYWIHSYLNTLINNKRRSNKYDFVFCYLSLRFEDTFHANILIYDFNNLSIERFDPYGSTHIDSELDSILEEELTWNTGLTYHSPNDYMPTAAFQTISDELNAANQKIGDYGGYCLAWCNWYLENRLLNKKVSNKILVEKLLKKLSQLDITFNEYIRNYANSLNKYRHKYLLKAGIDSNDFNNLYFTNKDEQLIDEYIITKLNKD